MYALLFLLLCSSAIVCGLVVVRPMTRVCAFGGIRLPQGLSATRRSRFSMELLAAQDGGEEEGEERLEISDDWRKVSSIRFIHAI